MKKTKIISTILTTAALTASVPAIATSCSCSGGGEPQPTPTEKTNINSLNWKFKDYYCQDTIEGIQEQIKQDNKDLGVSFENEAKGGDVAINVSINGEKVGVNVKAYNSSEKYKGNVDHNSQLAQDIGKFEWVFRNVYKADSEDEIKTMFLEDNVELFKEHEDLKENLDIIITIDNLSTNILAKTKENVEKYYGQSQQNCPLAENLATHNWNTSGSYTIQMWDHPSQLITQFEEYNNDIDYTKCNVTCDTSNDDIWYVYIEPNQENEKYYYNDGTGATKATIAIIAPTDEPLETVNYIETNTNTKYYLNTEFDLNDLCGEEKTLTINSPTYKGNSIERNIDKETITNITIGSAKNITTIGDYFLYNYKNLERVDLPSLTSVTSIGKYFLGFCTSLINVNLNGLTSVTSIKGGFLVYCTSLSSVDLTSLSSVTSIGADFLGSCTSLSSVDLTPLSSVTSIGNYFLSNCSSMTSVVLGDYVTADKIDDTYKYSFAIYAQATFAPAWKNGITLTGADKDNIKAKFPYSAGTNNLWRKWAD